MISSVTVKTEWPAKLPALKGKKFQFTKGITVLFGPNGCGKSTLLAVMAAHAACRSEGGWTKPLEPSYIKDGYPAALTTSSPGHAKAAVTWDGSPTFYHSADKSDAPIIAFGLQEDGLFDDVTRCVGFRRSSSGQGRMERLIRLAEVVKNPPNLLVFRDWDTHNSTWQDAAKKFKTFIKSKKRHGPVTILLDEPERSFDIPTQRMFWAFLHEKFKSFQVIVATHSPFALFTGGVTVVDLVPGYAARSKATLLEVVEGKAWSKEAYLRGQGGGIDAPAQGRRVTR